MGWNVTGLLEVEGLRVALLGWLPPADLLGLRLVSKPCREAVDAQLQWLADCQKVDVARVQDLHRRAAHWGTSVARVQKWDELRNLLGDAFNSILPADPGQLADIGITRYQHDQYACCSFQVPWLPDWRLGVRSGGPESLFWVDMDRGPVSYSLSWRGGERPVFCHWDSSVGEGVQGTMGEVEGSLAFLFRRPVATLGEGALGGPQRFLELVAKSQDDHEIREFIRERNFAATCLHFP